MMTTSDRTSLLDLNTQPYGEVHSAVLESIPHDRLQFTGTDLATTIACSTNSSLVHSGYNTAIDPLQLTGAPASIFCRSGTRPGMMYMRTSWTTGRGCGVLQYHENNVVQPRDDTATPPYAELCRPASGEVILENGKMLVSEGRFKEFTERTTVVTRV